MPNSKVCSLYTANKLSAKCVHPAYNGEQPGNTSKGVQLLIDVVKGEGVAKDRKAPNVFPIGSDAYEFISQALKVTQQNLEEWKDVIVSTDFPKEFEE